jgi:hypothetical protein
MVVVMVTLCRSQALRLCETVVPVWRDERDVWTAVQAPTKEKNEPLMRRRSRCCRCAE